VGCPWIDRWIGGDDHAAEAMATSHTWPILLEMRDQGGWSEVLWELADSMTGRGAIDVRATYREGLGC
jgi:hypothetical protein